MKRKILLMVGVLALVFSCGLANAGKTDCAIDRDDQLDNLEYQYRSDMDRPDSQGNQQSLEICLSRQMLTKDYIGELKQQQYYFNLQNSCSGEEKERINTEITTKMRKLNEDLESTWNRCEKVYGAR